MLGKNFLALKGVSMKLASCIYHSLCRREQVKTHSKHSLSHIHSWEIPQIDSDMERY